LAKGTPVLTADGRRVPVEQIRVGDRLASPSGAANTVLSLARGREQMFRVTPTKGEPYVVNGSHLLSLKRTPGGDAINLADGVRVPADQEHVVVRADVFAASNKTARHILKGWRSGVDAFENESASLPVPPYVLGIWLGDGSKADGVAALSKPVGPVVEHWVAWGESVGATVREVRAPCPTFFLRTDRGQANPALDAIREAGAFVAWPNIPRDYLTATKRDRAELLAGILDTDGSVILGGWDLVAKHQQTAEDIAFVARSLGLAAYVKFCRKRIRSTGFEGTYWRVLISGNVEIIPCRVKKPAHRRQVKNVSRVGIKLEAVGEGEYYGFELDGDRLFLLGDFTVTHNTLVAAKIILGATGKGNRATFTVPMVTLVDQAVSDFRVEGIDSIGVMQASHALTDGSAQVQVASVQTLDRRALPETSIVLVDECHISHRVIRRWMAERPDLVFVGLSATPGRAGMAGEWQDLIVATTTRELIDAGYLSKFRVFAPNRPDLSGVKIAKGEFDPKGSAEVMGEARLTADIVQNYLANGEGRPTLGFAVDVAHAKRMAADFDAAGLPSAYVEARTDGIERREIQRRFRAGEILVIWSVRTMTTGVDLPVSGIIDAAPTRSAMLHQQKLGRGLRINPGTEDLVIWDHAGNTERVGFLTDLDWSELPRAGAEKQRKKPAEPMPKVCGQCAAVMAPRVKVCEFCGHEAQPPSGWIETEDGDLVEVDHEAKAPKPKVTMDDKQRWFSALLSIAFERGYKPGWAANKYRERFGVWPRGLHDNAGPVPVEVRSWVKSRQIAFAKAREKSHAA
jgi:superfamily II DNA or RNA helicase